jgi:hypothetical protein
MSLAEIKKQAKELTPEELEELALHIESLRRTADPAWQEEIARRAEGNYFDPGSLSTVGNVPGRLRPNVERPWI